MSKNFGEFQGKAENYSDFEKAKIQIDTNLFTDDTTPEELSNKITQKTLLNIIKIVDNGCPKPWQH